MDIKESGCGVDPETHWYYQTKKLPLLRYYREVRKNQPPSRVYDIGAGDGFFSESLARENPGDILDIIQIDTGYTSSDPRKLPSIRGNLSRQRDMPASMQDSIILLMDVLEHVPDDHAFLSSIVGRCAGTNHFFITAPAFQSLWSGHDVYLGHHRRYRLPQLRDVVTRAGIRVTASYYIYASIFPAVWFVRRWLTSPERPGTDIRPTGKFLNDLLTRLCGWEISCGRHNTAFGVTCVIEGDK